MSTAHDDEFEGPISGFVADDDGGPSTEELSDEAPRCTDAANADAIAREHGKGYLYVVEWEAWIAWDGKRWDRMGARARVINAALLTARLEHYRTSTRLREVEEAFRQSLLAMQKDEALEAEVKYLAKQLKWHEQSQNMSRLEAAVRVLETRLTVSMKDLDKNAWFLNLANGTLDLRSAELKPHDPTDLITQLADVEWEDHASCPSFNAFIDTAMGGKTDLLLYLQRLIGYTLTAFTTEHILAFFYGEGSNGKSTFVQIIRAMLGEYACAAPRDLLFEDRNGQRHPSELARLYGKRMAVCAEIGEYVTLDEAKVKDLTGGDSVSVRRMREDFWDLEPTHTLFVAGNHKPTVRGVDRGIWRRIRLVPWLIAVEGVAVDKELPQKLKKELPGILRWAVNGCLEWQRIGLCEPEAVLAATAEYKEESDIFGEFAAMHLVFEPDARVSRKYLRERYERWCEDSGYKPFGPKLIAARLRQRGVESGRVREGTQVRTGWCGVRTKTDYELQCEAEPGTSNPTS